MKTSAICLSTGADPGPGAVRQRGGTVSAGFTILELLVVLALMATMTGLVLPRLASLYDAGQRSFERRQVLDSLAALPYQAFTQQQEFTLATLPAPDQAVPLELPPGWALEATEGGIHYRSNGFCTGGSLRLLRDDGAEVLSLEPPLCAPRVQ